MEKRKIEQSVVALLALAFLFSLIYTRSTKIRLHRGEDKATALQERFPEDKAIDEIPKPSALSNVAYEGGTKDPLKDLLQVYIYILEKDRPELKREVPLPRLAIEGLIWNTDMPQAIINGQVISVGDIIAGVKVVKIEREGITVEHEGEAVFIYK